MCGPARARTQHIASVSKGCRMTATQAQTQPFEAPGPGSWVLDAVHFPRPVTRYLATTQPGPFSAAFAEFSAYYGLPIATQRMAYVNGFCYGTMILVEPDELPQRFQRADEVFARRLWRDQLREWDEVAKPASIVVHRELQSVDPDAMTDEELSGYLVRCHDHHARMIKQHMRFTGAAVICVGDLLAHATSWARVESADVLATVRGAAPVSAGASEELDRLVAAITADPSARSLLMSDDDPAEILAGLRRSGNEVSAASEGFLNLVGYRLLDGFDISGRYALEMPDALVRAIRSWIEGPAERGPDAAAKHAELLGAVPEEHRAELDDLVAEARLMSRIRDERGVYSDIWAAGIMRRAALAAGRRLAGRERLHDPEHIVDATVDEMVQLLSGQPGPAADELADRAAYRAAHTAREAPPFLGEPPTPPPPADALPPAAGRVIRAFGTVTAEMFPSGPASQEEGALRGLAASGGVYVGPARVVHGPAEFGRIRQGDVLVTESTSEAFNILLPMLGAMVTDSGGLLSHAAIVAREYGIPGVVGTREATTRISDGARVRVDGDAGTVALNP